MSTNMPLNSDEEFGHKGDTGFKVMILFCLINHLGANISTSQTIVNGKLKMPATDAEGGKRHLTGCPVPFRGRIGPQGGHWTLDRIHLDTGAASWQPFQGAHNVQNL